MPTFKGKVQVEGGAVEEHTVTADDKYDAKAQLSEIGGVVVLQQVPDTEPGPVAEEGESDPEQPDADEGGDDDVPPAAV